MTRRESIVLLLGSLHDHLPSLGSNFKPTRGLVPLKRVACPDCGHHDPLERGWVKDRWGRRSACLTCGGSAEPTGNGNTWIATDAGSGFVRIDPMDAQHAPVSSSEQSAPATRPARVVDCDACSASGVGKPHLDDQGREYRDPCGRCGGSGKRVVARFSLDVDADRDGAPLDKFTAALELRNRAGSYHELDLALTTLTSTERNLVYAVYVAESRVATDLTVMEASVLYGALTLLELAMPEPIRVPSYVRAAAKRQREHLRSIKGRGTSAPALLARDKEIRKLARTGKPTQWIVAEYGLSVSQTNRIIRGEQEAA